MKSFIKYASLVILGLAVLAASGGCSQAAPTAAPPTATTAAKPAATATQVVSAATATPKPAAPAPTAAPGRKVRLALASGSPGGAWFIAGSAVSVIVNKYVQGIDLTVSTSPVANENIVLVNSGQLDFCFTTAEQAFWAYEGSHGYPTAQKDLTYLVGGPDLGQAFIVPADSPIKSIADFKGKRIGTPSPASKIIAEAMLKTYGMTLDDVKFTQMSYVEQVQAVKNGSFDAGYVSPIPFSATIEEYTAWKPMRFLSITPDKRAEYAKNYPYWTPIPIKAGTYKGQTEDWYVSGLFSYVLANKGLDTDLVYNVVKAIVEHTDELSKIYASGSSFGLDINKRNIDNNLIGTPLHPGAAKYYKEKGIAK